MIVGKSVAVLLKGPLAGQPVDELMNAVQVKRTRLQHRIELLNSIRQYYISRDAETSVRQNGLLLSGHATIKSRVDDTAHDVKGMAKNLEQLTQKTEEMLIVLQQERDLAKAREATLKKQAVCNRLMALFHDSHRKLSKLRVADRYANPEC